jgi:methionine aminopeptidase
MTAAFGVCPAEAIAAVIEACKDGAKVVDLCKIGDDLINKCVGSSCYLQQELLLLVLLWLWTPATINSTSFSTFIQHYTTDQQNLYHCIRLQLVP